MKTKPKQLGTAWESAVVTRLLKRGYADAERISEGGMNDLGDIRFTDYTGQVWTIEAKARANYNVTQGLAKAKGKAPDGNRVAVAWKKLTRKEGNDRRSADGEPDVVILDWKTFMELVAG